MRIRSSRSPRLLAIALAGSLLAAACTNPDDGSTAEDSEKTGAETGLVNVSDAEVEPSSGGTLNASLYSMPPTLDPAQTYGTFATSGIPMAAIYGVLMRYDPKSGDYAPRLAKSLSHSEDFTKWTLELRKGVKFSDGTPLDADAVVQHLKRLVEAGKTTIAPVVAEMVEKYEKPDNNTVVFHLSQSWSRFPYILATNGGMVTSPSAVKKYGEKYGQRPVGAGPFKLESYTPGEAVALTRNPDYWDGKVHLDKVRFTHIAGGEGTAERFRNGGVQMGVLQDSEILASLIEEGVPGYLVRNHGGGWVANQNEDRPTSDPRVRRAVAYAMNVDQLNQRAADGKAAFHRTLFPQGSPWDSGAAGVEHNPDKARKLVQEVKKETDWDGSLKLIAVQKKQAQWRESIALKGQLNAVGFKVDLQGLQGINQLTRHAFIKKDYDLAYWVLTDWNSAPWISLYSNLQSESDRNPYGYDSEEFDKLLGELRAAPTEEKRKEALSEIQQVWTKDQPMVLNKSSSGYVFWDDKVHGVQPTSLGVVLLDDAFIES